MGNGSGVVLSQQFDTSSSSSSSSPPADPWGERGAREKQMRVRERDTGENDRREYRRLDQLARSGHFHRHPGDYAREVTRAIEGCALAALELLIGGAGDARRLAPSPVHVAARAG